MSCSRTHSKTQNESEPSAERCADVCSRKASLECSTTLHSGQEHEYSRCGDSARCGDGEEGKGERLGLVSRVFRERGERADPDWSGRDLESECG